MADSPPDSPPRETPLRAIHEALGARMAPFAGWRMPVQYAGIIEEHTAVRERVGVFDISHMGQFFVSGPRAGAWLNRMLTNNVDKLSVGQGQYTLLLNDAGGVIDDLIIYRDRDHHFLLVVNASMISADSAWLQQHLPEDRSVAFEDRSVDFAGVAVQGPQTANIASKIFDHNGAARLPGRNGIAGFVDGAGQCYVCRTGYTGEDGFEFFCPAADGPDWLRKILDAGAAPCGLGARDTLRLEMGYPLNGADLSPDRTPLEAGLGFFVDLQKGGFIGRDTLARQKSDGLPSRLYALKLTTTGPPPRARYPVWLGDEQLGETCSGGISPSTGAGIAMAYLPPGKVKIGDQVDIEIRNRRFPAEIVQKPFYKRSA